MDPLSLPYETHPAFRFDARPLALTAEHVEAFCASYAQLEREGAHAPSGPAAATTTLSRIFSELIARSEDPDFRAFAAELRGHCERLLATDLEHFAAQRREVPPVGAGQRDRLDALARDHFYFGALPPEVVSALQEVARAPLHGLRASAEAGRVTREHLSVNRGLVAARLVRILDAEFERSGTHEVVSAYARRPMRVSGAALELSVASATWWRSPYDLARSPRTMYVHTDEGLANPKAIVYLTDVTAATGPMSLYPGCEPRLGLTPLQKLVGRVIDSIGTVPGSHLFALYARSGAPRAFDSPAFRRHFAMLPRSMRHNSHFGWDVVPDSPLEHLLAGAEVPMLGPAGTIAVFDGARLLHRGGLVEHGERVALQVVFSPARSRLAHAADRIALAKQQAEHAGAELVSDLRTLRRRVGRTVQRFSRKPHDQLVRAISRILPPLACIDVGASYYPHPPWDVFRASARTTWIAVEPNRQNTGYLEDWHWPSRTHLVPTGLSERGGEQTLYVTNTDSGSSLLPPIVNADMAHRVYEHDYYFPVTERRIATKSFDGIVSEVPDVAADVPLLIKLDTQGTELSILRGAEHALGSGRVVGIETEATLLANPVMAGSGKFWEVCQFLEARGFELMQLRPIEGGPIRPGSALPARTYLNECDAVFCLTRTQLAKRPPAHQLAAVGFYLSYHLYVEARSLFDAIPGIDEVCAHAGVDAAAVRRLLES